jgi:CDP-glucose 4,6-dehydratase
MPNPAFWSRQRVFLTGHTGFKGAWLGLWLERLGARVFGYALAPDTEPNLFSLLQPFSDQQSYLDDIRFADCVAKAVERADPTIAIHMAAQPLVRRSYREPAATFATNVMGTVHVLEALRRAGSLKAALIVTTDKVYRNAGDGRPFAETDPLGGNDPYSASKAAAELAVACWSASFFPGGGVAVATARAGNVIGGGDWSEDRLVPDVWRAVHAATRIELRYPQATRPWQHVLDPLSGYLAYLERLAEEGGGKLPAALNFGPPPNEARTVAEVAELALAALGGAPWARAPEPQLKESRALALDPALAERCIGWRARLTSQQSVEWTAEWYREFDAGAEARRLCLEQLERYEALR